MGDAIKTDYGIRHNRAMPGQPEQVEYFSVDDCGKILEGCLHVEGLASSVDAETGNVVLAFGTHLISTRAEILKPALAKLMEDADRGIIAAAQIATAAQDNAEKAAQRAQEQAQAGETPPDVQSGADVGTGV